MSHTTPQLDPDAQLLMHAAGELPAAEVAVVERMLAADPALRDRLSAMRATLADADAAFAAADAVGPSARITSSAADRAASAVRQWQVARKLTAAGAKPAVRPAARRWAMPAAAAAAAVIAVAGFAAWQANRPQSPLVDDSAFNTLPVPSSIDSTPDPLKVRAAYTLAFGDDAPGADAAANGPLATPLPEGDPKQPAMLAAEALAVAVPLSDEPILSFEVPAETE